jgi:hypothetical protein
MGRILEMVARVLLGLISLTLAMFFMRLISGQARRAHVPRRTPEAAGRGDAALLKQDPVSGVYYPAD